MEDNGFGQAFINGVMLVVSFLLAWFGKSLRDSVKQLHESDRILEERDKELADELKQVRILVAGDYVRRDQMSDLGREIFSKLESMRLESKADLRDVLSELKTEISKKADR